MAEPNNFDARPEVLDESVEQITLEKRDGVFFTEVRDAHEPQDAAGK
jgi:hypothetical protein